MVSRDSRVLVGSWDRIGVLGRWGNEVEVALLLWLVVVLLLSLMMLLLIVVVIITKFTGR
jgi:hypothetical protein